MRNVVRTSIVLPDTKYTMMAMRNTEATQSVRECREKIHPKS